MKKELIALFLPLLTPNSFVQNSLKGKIADENKQPVLLVNVTVKQKKELNQ